MLLNAVLWTAKIPVPKKGLNVRITEKDLKLPPERGTKPAAKVPQPDASSYAGALKARSLFRQRVQPLRYSRRMNLSASGQPVAFSLAASHWIFLPTRYATVPRSTASVSAPE